MYRSNKRAHSGIVALTFVMCISAGCDLNKRDRKSDDAEGICPSAELKACSALTAEIGRLNEEKKSALAQNSLRKALEIGVELNTKLDTLRAYQSTDSADLDAQLSAINGRHELMGKIITDPDPSELSVPVECSGVKHCGSYVADRKSLIAQYLSFSEDSPDNEQLETVIALNYLTLHLNHLLKDPEDQKGVLQINGAYNRVVAILVDDINFMFGYRNEEAVSTGTFGSRRCIAAMVSECARLSAAIPDLRARRNKAIAEGDVVGANELSLELNLSVELLDLYMSGHSGSDAEVADVFRRHQVLVDVVDGQRPAYNSIEKGEVDKVMKQFGPLYIKESAVENGVVSKISVSLKKHKPWSGYWYPFRHGEAHTGEDSPLVKFDKILQAHGREAGSVKWDRARQELGQPWESSDGLCDAWAIASALMPEPTKPVSIGSEVLSPAAIKGIAVQKFANFSREKYGISYKGYIETDGLAQDLRPEAFHRLVTSLLQDEQVPLVDTDPNFPIWNMPLFKYDWIVAKDPSFDSAFIVTARPSFVKFRKKPSSVPTQYTIGRDSDLYMPVYRYRLFVDKQSTKAEGYRVLYGEWILDEFATSYPDTVFVAKAESTATPRNPFIGKNLDIVEKILKRID